MGNERLYWLGFSLVKGFGATRVRQLLEHFGSLEAAWSAGAAEMRTAGVDRRAWESLRESRGKIRLDTELSRLDKLGIALLTWADPEYPPLLRALRPIDEAPPVLYVRGSLTARDEWAVTVVGTRSISPYGRQATFQIVSELASQGATVVSGLARGVDSEAHQAALDAGGRTLAVLPCGLESIYPPEHRKLAGRIMQQGALISPFPLGATPDAHKFPPRNRVMAGLARGVLVIEAGDKSGALLTAGYALEYGREVFAVPGNITARASSGVNRLIQDGASPVLSARDVIETLDLGPIREYVQARQILAQGSSEEEALLQHLSADPQHVDELVRATTLPVAQVTSLLLMMQLKGMVREVGPMTFVRS